MSLSRIHLLAAAIAAHIFAVPSAAGQELTRYRGYTLESNTAAALEVGASRESDVRTVHERPSRIQELEWRVSYLRPESTMADPVRNVLLRFIDNRLYRIAVTYDSDRTEGLTTGDIVNSLSSTYGAPSVLAPNALTLATADLPASAIPVAKWEDAGSVLVLTRTSSYRPQFHLVLLSKSLAASARVAIRESVRLDTQQAPQRAIDQREKETADALEAKRTTREANKAAFKP